MITDVNDKFCEISGYSATELIGNTHNIVNSGHHPPEFFIDMWQTIVKGETWSGLIVNKRKDGELYYVHSIITPISDIEGNVESYLALRFDASNFYKTKAMLDRTLDILNETSSIAKVGGWEMELETEDLIWTDETYAILEVEKTDGQRPKLEQGVHLFTSEYVPIIEDAVSRCVQFGEPYSLEMKALTAKGNELWVYTNGKANYVDGKIVSISGTIQDIDDRKTAEIKYDFERQKSIHNAKLASLGELAASIVHEINNPLAIIKGSSFLLNKFQDSPEKIPPMLDEIEKSCDRISRIIVGLKKFVRMREESVFEVMNLDEIIKESLLLTQSKMKRNHVGIDFTGSSTHSVMCDEIEVEQVLVNLINNSIDAIKDLDTKWIKIHLEESENTITIKIIDSGDGIDKELREKLFEPFFTTKAYGKGTGLGLSIVKGIMVEHNGSIAIDGSNPNTCFVLKFPIYDETQEKERSDD